ncbi:MAG: winged helix-turn-helix domain-containing protein [Gemmatimonadota bacterium]
MTYRFGPFELDPAGPILRRSGRTVPITQQPLKLLLQLVMAEGEIVTREAIHANLWAHPYVEVDQGINQCVRRIRAALGDDPSKPFFVETLPRRGYRFICPVEATDEGPAHAAAWPRGPWILPWGLAAGTILALAASGYLLLGDGRSGAGDMAVETVQTADLVLAGAVARMDRRKPSFVEQAVSDLDALVASEPDLPAPRLRLAVAYSTLFWYSGRDEAARAARSHLRRAEELGGDPARVWFTKGVLSFHDRDFDAALSAFARAREIDPVAIGTDLDLMVGKTLRRTGRWEEARDVFTRAYEANPTSFEITYAMASTSRHIRDHEMASRFLELAHELDAGHWAPWAIRPVDALREGGDVELAARRAEESAEVLGYGLLFSSSQTLARVLSDVVVRERPTFDGPDSYGGAYHLSMAEAYRVQGMATRAREHYDSAAILLEAQVAEGGWPESYRGQPLSWLAAAEAGRGNNDRALELTQDVLAIVALEDDAMVGAILRVQAAQMFMVLGDHEAALELVELLLARPSFMTPALLDVDPIWAPIRDHPRLRGHLVG